MNPQIPSMIMKFRWAALALCGLMLCAHDTWASVICVSDDADFRRCRRHGEIHSGDHRTGAGYLSH